ncbi:sulfatase family protein [Tichowtungia aerotolerans]|uniref:Sulfatase-like hydrolase/transferase n=1 Tax=Tichowtungia aerotolerans TaxID=2697043 RepID=A0A6P1M2L6_9BACT|nr:arylsulfatase [Tichowtungia aerotolerans]QHI68840.1 sulfatase-like hydrolase/transferase [Tichowtungia aerotolerans]
MKNKWNALLLAAAAAACVQADAGRPNVLLIIADDLGLGDVGCYGSKWIKTPNIDRLAAEGIRAMDAHSTAAVCTPSRYSILSGRYYHRYPRNWNGEALIEADRPTIASVFRDNGYATGYFGKVHTGWGEPSKDRKHRQDLDWNRELPRGVLEMGFDTYFGTPFTHNEPPFVFVKDRHVVGLDPDDPLICIPKDVERGPWGWGASKGAKAAHEARPVDQIDLIVTEKAIEFIKGTAGKKPFFINLALVAPHVPVAPSKDFKGRTELGWYGDFVEQMDWCVGQVFQTLEQLGQADNTLIIFTSDNGAIFHKEYLAKGQNSNLDFLGQKTDAWEGGVRVPFIVRWPGKVPAGKTLEPLISLMDISKTVWAAAGIMPPAGASPDALNQLDLITGKTDRAIRNELYMIGITGTALRSGDWVYIPQQGSCGITTLESATWAIQLADLGQTNSDYNVDGTLKEDAPGAQLYNLRNDPGQSKNVIRDYPEKAAELAARFKEVSKR